MKEDGTLGSVTGIPFREYPPGALMYKATF